MNVYYLNNKGLWSRDSADAVLLFQVDYAKYYLRQGGSWVEIAEESLSPLQKGYFWYFRKEGEKTFFRGVLPTETLKDTLLSGLELMDAQGLKSSPEELGSSFYLTNEEALLFFKRGKNIGAHFKERSEQKEKVSYSKKIDDLLREDLLFLRELKAGDVSNRPLFHDRGRSIRDLAERAMQQGEDVSEKLLLRAQIEAKAEGEGDIQFSLLLELLHSSFSNSTLEEEGLWLHFPEGDIWIGSDKSIFLRSK